MGLLAITCTTPSEALYPASGCGMRLLGHVICKGDPAGVTRLLHACETRQKIPTLAAGSTVAVTVTSFTANVNPGIRAPSRGPIKTYIIPHWW